MHRNPTTVSTKQQRIAELAKQSPQMAFTSLAHQIDIDWLHEAYQRTRKDGAVGVDGQTAEDYEQDLEGNLQVAAGPRQVRHVPGTARAAGAHSQGRLDTETRPIGIPTLEDKVLQRAVVMVLEPIYEQDFLDCSYGFRPGRSAHQALEAFWDQMMDSRGGWVVEVDIRKFFDTLDHGHLRAFLQHRVRDGVLLRLIGKWLNAGVLEDGSVSYPDAGTPQGGVISPLLANIFLHYVLDVWFEQEVKPRLRRRAFLIRYADDFVIGFRDERDARRVHGSPAQAVRQVRLDDPPRQDAARAFSAVVPLGEWRSRRTDANLRGRSTCWASPTTGGDLSKATGSSSRRRRTTASAEQCGALIRGAGLTGTCRSAEQQQKLNEKLTRSLRVLRRHGQLGGPCHGFSTRSRRRWRKWLYRRNRLRSLTWAKFCRPRSSVTRWPRCARSRSLYRHAANP